MAEEPNIQDDQFRETYSDDNHILTYLLRRIKGISPVAGEPVDGLPGVDDIIESMNS